MNRPLTLPSPHPMGRGEKHARLLGCILLAAWLAGGRVCGQEEGPFTRIYDRDSTPIVGPLIKTGWRIVPEDNVSYKFSGEPVLANDKLTVVLRKQGGANVYVNTPKGLAYRAGVGYSGADFKPNFFDTFQILENTSGGVMVKATLKNDPQSALKFRLTTGEAILEIRSEGANGFVGLETKTHYVVVPDYFGDDMVFGVEDFRGQALPAENFCLHLLQGGDAIIMSVWQSREQEAWLAEARRTELTTLCTSRIACLKGKSVWLAFLESRGLWQTGAMPKDWKSPFPAKWRCSAMRDNGAADSWDLEKGPAPEQTSGTHQGPMIIYPIDRSVATPLTATCPTDIMRNTLGVGPCQYILACEGLAAEGNPTPNDVMNWVEKQFEQKKDNKAIDDIKERLEQMAGHAAHARARIERYAEFAGQIRKLLAGKEGAEQFRAVSDDMDRFLTAGLGPAASPQRARQLAGEVAGLIGKENGLTTCKTLGAQLRAIGAAQDSTLARCRMAVRRLKQQGRTMPGTETKEGEVAQQVHRLAEKLLQAEDGKK